MQNDVTSSIEEPPPGKTSFPASRRSLSVWARALRLQHWVKNILVFVGPILAFDIARPTVVAAAALLFVLFGLVASATYLLNDAVDLDSDRQHPTKQFRPLASSEIPISHALIAAACLLMVAFAASTALPAQAIICLAAYLGITLAYSFGLKRQPMLDVLMLAGLFTIRVVAGGFVSSTPISHWLLTFSMLFFLGLALVKRYAELERIVSFGGDSILSRGYSARDLPLLLTAGVGAGLSAVVIFVVYLIDEQYPRAIYQRPEALWTMVPILLIWTLRIWHLTVNGRVTEDPVVFAIRDKVSVLLGVLAGSTLLVAWSWQ